MNKLIRKILRLLGQEIGYCKDCAFYHEANPHAMPICRRFPPNGESAVPNVLADDWCGEFRPFDKVRRFIDKVRIG